MTNRTPDELRNLKNFGDNLDNGHMYQVWHVGELKATVLTYEQAKAKSKEFWIPKGFTEFHWSAVETQAGYEFISLEVYSDTGHRWMTTNTMIVDVDASQSLFPEPVDEDSPTLQLKKLEL